MGFLVDGTHDEKLKEDGWISFTSKMPKDHQKIYIRCKIMMDEFVVTGYVEDGIIKSIDCDPDIFMRCGIEGWKLCEIDTATEWFEGDMNRYMNRYMKSLYEADSILKNLLSEDSIYKRSEIIGSINDLFVAKCIISALLPNKIKMEE